MPHDKEQPVSSLETDLILLALPNLDFTKTKRTKSKAKNQSDASITSSSFSNIRKKYIHEAHTSNFTKLSSLLYQTVWSKWYMSSLAEEPSRRDPICTSQCILQQHNSTDWQYSNFKTEDY